MATFSDELFNQLVDNVPSEDGFDDDHAAEWYMEGRLSALDLLQRFGVVQTEAVIDNVALRWGEDEANNLGEIVVDMMIQYDIGA